MAVSTHRKAVFIGSKTLCCFEIKFRPGCIDQIIIVNVFGLSVPYSIGILNRHISFLDFRITCRMDCNSFGLFEHNAPTVINFFQLKTDIINSHLANSNPDI